MKRPLLSVFLLAIAVAVTGFFAAPGVAFFALRSAAQSGDTGSLAELVDFAAVRQSLRPQLDDRPEARVPPPAFLEDPIGAVRRQLEDAARPAVDVNAYLTPAALAGLTAGEGRFAAARSRPGGAAPDADGEPWPSPLYWGVNRTRMGVTDEAGSQTVFTFERRGAYRWVLVHVGLPEGGNPAAPAASPGA